MTAIAKQASPIFIGDLVQAYVGQQYPAGTVLVCNTDENGDFGSELLEKAFGEKGLESLCGDITSLCVIEFDGDTTPEQVKKQMCKAAKALDYPDDFKKHGFDEAYTIYSNGKPV